MDRGRAVLLLRAIGSKSFTVARVAALLLLVAVIQQSAVIPVADAQTVPAHLSGQRISAVEIEGNSRIEDSTILLQVKSAPGTSLSSDQVATDIKNIYRTGFFEQVRGALRTEGGAGVRLVFLVSERPAIRQVLIEGNKEIESDEIKEKLNLGAKLFLDESKLGSAIEEVKRFYQSQGFFGTKASYKVTPIQQNQVDVVLQIDEGEKKRIREVAFEGNGKVDSDDLEDVIETSDYKWWSSWLFGTGIVKQETLQNDVRELNKYYLNHGYVDVKIAEPVVEEIDEGLKVVFKLEEGAEYSFGKISASGDLVADSAAATVEGGEAKEGETFSAETLRQDTFKVSEKFTDVGYAFANVEPLTSINRRDKKVDVNYQVDKGSLIKVDRINISGNKKTQDNVVRRSLYIGEQELFSSSKIRRSQELLQRLGYFDEVTITPEPTTAPDSVDLNVSVREGNTGTFSAGAGISSGDGFIVSTRISENNLFGTGNSLTLDLNTGSERENYVLSFANPRVYDTRWSLGVDGLITSREYDDFDKEQAGGSISAGYPLWFLGQEYLDDIRFNVQYELLRIDISDVDEDAAALVKDNEGKSTSSSVTPQLIRNTIDNPLDPTSGSKQTISTELAGLGGDEEFYLIQASNTFFYPLITTSYGPIVFSQRTRVGYGEAYDSDEDFPLFRRFFPGGINSVRGYDARELGPEDEQGNNYGGNKQLIFNFELIYPLIPSFGLSLVTFYDAGEAFDDDVSIDVAELRQAIGWGIRWRSPIAPIRIEFGYPIDKEEDESSFVTNFSFGAPGT